MRFNFKRNLAIGASALAAIAFAGGAYAATQDSGANPGQAFLNDVAKRLKVTPQQLTAAMRAAFFDQLDAAVAAGRLTKAQANAIKQRVQQAGAVPLGGGRLFGPEWFGGGPPVAPGLNGLAAAANYLGLTETQLMEQLGSTRSLAQVAKARGKSVAGLKGAITAAQRSALDKAVADKQLTSAEEQGILSRVAAHLDDLINGTRPQLGMPPRFGPGASFGPDRRPVPGSGLPMPPDSAPAPPGRGGFDGSADHLPPGIPSGSQSLPAGGQAY